MSEFTNLSSVSLALLSEVGRELVGELDRDRLLRLSVEQAGRLFGAHGAIYALHDARLVPAARTDRIVAAAPLPLGRGVVGLCAQARRGVLVNDYASSPHALPALVAEGVACAMAQPLVAGAELLGVIVVSRRVPGATFAEADLALLERFALLAALALRNANRYEESERGRREARELARIAALLNDRLDVISVCHRIVESVPSVLPVASSIITLAEPDGALRGIAQGGAPVFTPADMVLPRGVGVTGRAVETGQPVWSADVRDDPRFILPERVRRRITASGHRAFLAVPLRSRGRCIGALTVADHAVRAFTDVEIGLVQAFADQAAVALGNAQLYEDTEQRRREAEELARAAQMVTAPLDASTVAAQVAESLMRVFDAGFAGVARLAADGSLTVLAIRGAATELVDAPAVELTDELRRRVMARGNKTILSVPLRVEDRTIGVVQIGFRTQVAISEREAQLAQTFTDHAAIALRNAALYEEAQDQRREAEVLAEIAQKINASLAVDTVLQRVVEGTQDFCDSDCARIALRAPGGHAAVFRYVSGAFPAEFAGMGLDPGKGLVGRVLATGEPVRTDDYARDPRLTKDYLALARLDGTVTALGVPIRIRGEVRGVILVFNRSPRPFTDRHEAVLTKLAEHAAVAIGNAQLFEEIEATRERLRATSARLLEVQEAERRHIARELHDEMGQALTAIKINLQVLRRQEPQGGGAQRIEDSLHIVDRILQSVRRLSLDLRPSMLDDLGLATALQWYVETQAHRSGLITEVTIEPLAEEPPPLVAVTCFRVAQEAITNVLRHANATRVFVDLRSRDAQLELIVRDDGVGFDVVAMRGATVGASSLGLLGLVERVELTGGRSTITSTRDQGTEIRAWFPLPRGAGAEVGQVR